ncbi:MULTISPECIES: HAD family hydrolase [Methanobacterium]|uniref:Haloacid dehalogenase n=1 Tax=Methanobacterium bryantii TaxID=2161 RepID=A0A2A2H179_METBR|nr:MULTISPECIES: HAD family hydrolase [Methanobacterium]OEC86395.1 haloacid dehalogenase [Methanobacterium sp. A39]PAV03056.1 haloacid dehalogenase [Methanobacterium bryantii]
MVQNNVLMLFDIDGTLVQGAKCHYQAYIEGVKKFYGMEEYVHSVNAAGKSDKLILREILALGGLTTDEIQKDFQSCLDFMTDYYLKNVQYENIHVFDGTIELLDELQRKNVLLGLVTGNLEPIAYAKLGRAGLNGYFSFGGFGSDNADRSLMVKKALSIAKNQLGFNGDKIFVVGDTPRDVEAAKAYNLKTIAVATGMYSVKELKDCGADYVVENFKNRDKILEILYE